MGRKTIYCKKITKETIRKSATNGGYLTWQTAGTILLTEAVVVDKPEEKKGEDGFGGMMGMM